MIAQIIYKTTYNDGSGAYSTARCRWTDDIYGSETQKDLIKRIKNANRIEDSTNLEILEINHYPREEQEII